MSWPETFPEFISAGKLANWLEHYAESMELNVWVKSHVVPEKTYFDEKGQKWHVTIDRDGQENAFVVDHIVLATGLCGKPKMPKPFPGQEKFIPDIIHSTQHKGGDGWKGKNVLVVGTGSSGHDISLDLCNHGANPTILQRSPTYVLSIKNGIVKTLNGDLMVEGVNLDYADRITEAMPKAVTKAVLQKLVPKIAELDKDLLQGLKKAGFQTYLGPDSSGSLFLSMERGGGFYFESGASQKIIDGGIKVKNGEIDHFTENSVVFKDGTNMEPDLVIFCTGYTGFKESVCETLGEEYGNQLSKIWGLDCEGEINGLYRDCGLPNTYFMSGALPINRPYSKLLALQIAAQKLGRLGPRYSIEQSRKSGNYVDLSGLLYQ
jgi:cation diffusion facilitator CzcD-associated flavoprotein CzcO